MFDRLEGTNRLSKSFAGQRIIACSSKQRLCPAHLLVRGHYRHASQHVQGQVVCILAADGQMAWRAIKIDIGEQAGIVEACNRCSASCIELCQYKRRTTINARIDSWTGSDRPPSRRS